MPVLKKTLASNPRPFYKPRYVYEIYNWKIKASQLFKLCHPLEYPNTLPQLQNYYPLYRKIKSSKQIYFVSIRLISRIFCKNRFYSFVRNLLLGFTMKILHFQSDLAGVKALAYVIRIIPAIIHIFFQNCVCLDYLWVESMQYVQDRIGSTRKANNVAGNGNKVIACNVLEITWNDKDCCLNIVIGPKVADTAFKYCTSIFNN